MAAANAVVGKWRELAGFAGLAVAVLVSAVSTIAVTGAAGWLFGLALKVLAVLIVAAGVLRFIELVREKQRRR